MSVNIISTLNNSANLLACAIVFATASIATYKTLHERKKNKIKTKKTEKFNLLFCSLLCGGIAIACIVSIGMSAGLAGIALSMIIMYVVVVNAVYVVFGKLEKLDIKDNKLRVVDKPKKNKRRNKR
ncbi:hypothetical protein AB7303_03525 [Providencia rettgeri]|uniref:hypothetical protein n=1 Tax=Providencia sp. TaxID=589 RepID=UPI001B79C6A0|nr:hypothetical protein [Providencia sp.]